MKHVIQSNLNDVRIGGNKSAGGFTIGLCLLLVLIGAVASSNQRANPSAAGTPKAASPLEGYWLTDCFTTLTPLGGYSATRELVRIKKNPSGYDIDSRMIYFRDNNCQASSTVLALSTTLKASSVASQDNEASIKMKAAPVWSAWYRGASYPTDAENLEAILGQVVNSQKGSNIFDLKLSLFQQGDLPYGYTMVIESSSKHYLNAFKPFILGKNNQSGKSQMQEIPDANLLFKKIGELNTPYLVMFPDSTLDI